MFKESELTFFLLDNVTEGTIIFNFDFKVVYINQMVPQYLGLPRREIMGKKCAYLLNGLFCNADGVLAQALEARETRAVKLTINDQPFLATGFIFKGPEGNEKPYKIVLLKPLEKTEAPSQGKISPTYVNAAEFGERILEDISDLAEAKNIAVSLDVKDGVEEIYIDPEQMELSIMSFLSRAINFSNRGKIIIKIMERETGYSNLIRIENPDEKIKETDLQNLENSFYQGTDKAKNIVEAHGGRLWIDTDKGFAIVFSIPKDLL